jgi:Flp pilus assembly protein TadD
MQIRWAILVVMLTGLYGYAQQAPPSGQSSQQSTQDTIKTSSQPKQSGKPSPADANPFPEAASRNAQNEVDAATSDGKSTAPGYSSSHVDMTKFDASAGSENRISNGAGGFVHDPELAARDDKVGKFYLQTGDFKGAYDRFKEASEVAPEDGDAVFGLAESARGLHKTEEATSNYRLYLDAFPDGKKAKEARKALLALNSPQKK